MKPININNKFSKFDKQWHPHQIAEVDNMQVILAKLKGEFVWHSHDNADELFQVIKGTLYMKFETHTEIVNEGEIIVVPKGVQHCPTTKDNEEVHVLLFEKKNVSHTGDVVHDKTVSHYPKI